MGHLTAKEASEKAKLKDTRIPMDLDELISNIEKEVENGNYSFTLPAHRSITFGIQEDLKCLGYNAIFYRPPYSIDRVFHISW